MKVRESMLWLVVLCLTVTAYTASLHGDCTLDPRKCQTIGGKCPNVTDTSCTPLSGTLYWVKVTSWGNHDLCDSLGIYDSDRNCCIDSSTERSCAEAKFYSTGADCFADNVLFEGEITAPKAHPDSIPCGVQA